MLYPEVKELDMEGNVTSGISRFGRLRKVSTKLIDLPKRSPHTAHRNSKRNKCSPSSSSVQKNLTKKLKSPVSVDPFVDFTPDMFDGLLASEETDTSSSVGDESDESEVMWEPSNRMVTKRNQKISRKQKVFS